MLRRQTRDRATRTSHPGWGVSIDDIFCIYDKAELGLLRDLCDLFDDIAAKDLTLSGLVETRTGAVLGCKVAISPGGDDPDSIALAHAFEEMLDRWEIDLYALIQHHQYSRLFYGYSLTELIWKWHKGRYEIGELVHPRSRSFRVATEINRWLNGAALDELLLQVDGHGTEFERLWPDKWLITRRMEGEKIIPHAGMMYQTAPMSVMKMDVTIDWTAFINRFGLPFPIATINSWEDARAVDAARQTIQTLGTTNGLITTTGDDFTLAIHDGANKARGGNSDLHGRFAQFANIEMAKYWLGGYLASEQGSGAGSYAQAVVHKGLLGYLTDHDKGCLVRTIIRMAAMYRRVNRLPGRLPRAAMYPSQVQDTANATKMARDMNQVGAPVDARQLYDLTGFRPAPKQSAQEKAA